MVKLRRRGRGSIQGSIQCVTVLLIWLLVVLFSHSWSLLSTLSTRLFTHSTHLPIRLSTCSTRLPTRSVCLAPHRTSLAIFLLTGITRGTICRSFHN